MSVPTSTATIPCWDYVFNVPSSHKDEHAEDAKLGSGSDSRSGSMGVARSKSGTRSTSAVAPTTAVVAEAPATTPVPAPQPQERLPEAKRNKVKPMIELCLLNPDDDEMAAEIQQVFPPQYHADVVTEMLNVALDKTAKEVGMIAKSLLHLVSTNTILPENFVAGLKEILEFAPDLHIDIPMLYEYLGKFIAPHIEKEHITLLQLYKLCDNIISSNHGPLLLKAVIGDLKDSMGPSFIKSKWQESALQLNQWMSEDQAMSVPTPTATIPCWDYVFNVPSSHKDDHAEDAKLEENIKYSISLEDIDLALLEKWERKRHIDGIIPIWDKKNLSLRHEDYLEFEVYIKNTQKDHNFDDQPSSEEEMDLETYIKIVNTVQPSGIHTLTVFDDYFLEIKTMTGEKVMVSVDSYLGYSNVRDYVQCLVCRIVVKDTETHKLTMGHLKKMVKPLRNIHCIRQIDTIWNHCVICNEIVENTELHTSTYQHKTQLQQAITDTGRKFSSKTKRKRKTKTVTPSLIINNQSSLKTPADLRTHIEIPPGDLNTRQDIPKTSANSTSTPKDSKTIVDCNTVQNISKAPVSEITNIQTIQKLPTGDLKTTQKIPKTPTGDHNINSNIPKTLATDLARSHKILDETAIKNAPQMVLKAYLPDIRPSTGKDEAQGKVINGTALQIGQNSNNVKPNTIFCDVCKAYVPNSVYNIQTHYCGSPHKKNLNKLNVIKSNQSKCKIPQNNTAPKAMVSHLKDTSIVTQKHSNVYCKICDLVMHQNNLSSHLNGKLHKYNVQNHNNGPTATVVHQEVVTDNKIVLSNSKGKTQYFCSICKVEVTNNATNIKEHDEGRQHKTNVLLKAGITVNNFAVSLPATNDIVTSINNATQSATFTNKNATNTTSNTNLKNVPSANTVHNSSSVVVNQEVITNDQVVLPNPKGITPHFCSTCKVNVPNIASNIKEHYEGKNHKTNFNILLNKNTGAIVENNTVSIPVTNDILKSVCKPTQSAMFNKNAIETTNRIGNVVLTTNTDLKNVSRVNTVHSNTSVVSNVFQSTAIRAEKASNSKESTSSTALDSKNLDKTLNKAASICDIMEQTHDAALLNCQICEVKVPNNNSNIQEHIMGFSHKMKLNCLMLTNRIKEDGNSKYLCEFCKFSFTRTDFCKHIKTSYHTILARWVTENEIKSVDIQNKDVKSDGGKNQASHKGQNPKQNNNKENSTSSINQASTSGVNQITSKSNCSTDIAFAKIESLSSSKVTSSAPITHADKTTSNIYTTVSSVNHELSTQAMSKDDSDEKNRTDFATYEFRDKLSTNIDGVSRVKASNVTRYVVCKYCRLKLSANDTNMVSHTSGSCINDLLWRHGMTKLTEYQLFCGLCVNLDSLTDVLDHINGSVHKTHYDSGKIPEVVPLNIRFPVTEKKIHGDLEFNYFGNLFCPVCKICVPNNSRDMSIHVASNEHNDKREHLMKVNKMRKYDFAGSGHRCGYCKNYILKGYEIVHIRSQNHILRVKEAEALRVKEAEALRVKEAEALRVKEAEALKLKEAESLRVKAAEELRVAEAEAKLDKIRTIFIIVIICMSWWFYRTESK